MSKNGNNINTAILMKEYIKALILNIDHSKLKKEINLVFDGGAFNGGFAAGVAMYIKTLENNKIIKINKISGCSIGSAIALWYICGCNENAIIFFEKTTTSFKDTMDLRAYQTNIREFVNFLFPSGDVSALKNKLYINFYDTYKHKQKIVSNFKSVEHLTDCILQSSHIPYIIDGTARYNERYIDGIIPHIFKDGETIFIKLLTLDKCTRSMVVKCETNIHYRLISGVADANSFFTTGSSDMCSYVSQWSYFNILQIRSREIIIIFIISIIEWFILIKNNLPKSVKKSLLYNGCINSVKGLCCDILQRTLI
jgi:hypothetical protein